MHSSGVQLRQKRLSGFRTLFDLACTDSDSRVINGLWKFAGDENLAGRPKGPDKRTAERRLVASAGITWLRRFQRAPVEVMLARMNGVPWAMALSADQIAMAVAAAPYVHPRLAAVAIQETADPNLERRRDMLRGLNYQQRQQILDILATAQVQQIEAVAESADVGPGETETNDGAAE